MPAGRPQVDALRAAFIDEMGERLQVLQRLAPRHPPRPFPADRRGEAQLQQRVEVVVDRLEHLPEYPVDLVGGHRGQRHPADEVDVAEVVERVGDPVQPPVAFEQEPVDGLVVLVGLAADERLHPHRVLADRQDRVGLESALARQFDDQPGWAAVRALVVEVRQRMLVECVLDDLLHRVRHARIRRRTIHRRPLRRDASATSALR